MEDQATDRAHRIGQTKVVTSYKFNRARYCGGENSGAAKSETGNYPRDNWRRRGIRAALSWEEIQELLA